jgi:nitronate monooxygenase
MLRDLLRSPIILAPMAGGPGTPRLAAAVSDAGGFPFLAGGYKTAEAVAAEIAAYRAAARGPFGVNLFVPQRTVVDGQALRRYGERLRPEAERFGVRLGEPVWDDDAWDAKLAAILDDPVPAVSFTFGCPDADVIGALRHRGILVIVTVTTPGEARQAAAAGADALCVQGSEAGAHQGSFDNTAARALGLLEVLAQVRAAVRLPLIAAGGVMRGSDVAAAVAAGATAAQCGTAFLLCPESGTHPTHREALVHRRSAATALTRAFTGRWARAILNRFLRTYGADAPAAYPHVHHLTRPLRRAAADAGDAETLHLWAGEGFRAAEARSAGEVVARLVRGAQRTA